MPQAENGSVRHRRSSTSPPVGLAFLGAVALAAVPAAPAFPPTYRVEPIGPGSMQPFAMNERGDVAGREVSAQSVGRAFVAARGGAVELLPLPSPWVSSDAYQLNEHGLVVGAVSTASIASIGSHAAAWRRTAAGWAFELLPPFPGDQHSTATAVNNLGDIVGGSGGLGLGLYPRAVRFTPGGADLLPDMPLPAGVNDDRVVLGWSTMLDLDTMARTTVPLPPGNWQGVLSTDFSASGAFCGSIMGYSGCSTFPVRYRPAAGWEFVGGCATTTSATSINARGDALAYVANTTTWVAFVGEENAAIGPLVDPADGTWAVTSAVEINDRRMIAAVARRGPAFAVPEAVRLVPVVAADLDRSGRVDGADLALLLGDWGRSGVPADLDASGTVEGGDLAVLLGAWD